MASSKSFQKGQFPLSCNSCKSGEIKWKCRTCQSFMCSNKCYEFHIRSKSTDKHDIIALQTDFYDISCSQHTDQKCCLYCKQCEDAVCPLCIATVHNTHKMAELSEGYQISMNIIQNRISEIERDILKLTSDVSKLDSIRSAERSRFNEVKEKILNHEKALKDAIEKHSKHLLSNLDQRWKILENKLHDEETYAKEMNKDLETENKSICKAMDSNNAREVFQLATDGCKLKKKTRKSINTKYVRLPGFVPGEINVSSVESIHGTLEEIKDQNMEEKIHGTLEEIKEKNMEEKIHGTLEEIQKQNKEQNIQIEVKEQYTTTFPYVQALACCDNGLIWVSDFENEIIQNVKLSHGSIYVYKTINLQSAILALTPSGDLLLSTGKTKLQIISCTTGEVKKSKFSVSPLRTTTVHVSTTLNKILVGAKESGPSFPASGPRQVVVMDMKGRNERVLQYDNNKKPLFTYPYKITTDKDNNIYVIDWLSGDGKGRVVVLGQGGGVRGIYTGHPNVNDTEHLFTPRDIVTTQSDKDIVSDIYNHTLHILNNNVQCVQYLNTKRSGIEWPMSLYIDNRGFLFIGSGSYKGESDAKIHVVQLVNSS